MKITTIRELVLLLFSMLAFAGVGNAQSSDIAAPWPVRTNEVSASIAARDIGDARLTDHFYAFTGTPGDLLITVDSRNMNGDIDVFTAVGLRPLLKFTVYAGAAEPTTKSVFLRQRQDLILRVEARTPNDDDAVYRIHFGGAFEPIAGGPLLGESGNPKPAEPGGKESKKGRRVSSVGARIEERTETVAAAPTPEPTPAETAKATATKTPARSARGHRPARGRTRPEATKKEAPAEATTAEASSTKLEPSETPAAAKPAASRRASRRGAARTAQTEPEPDPNTGPRLVIETSDGTLIERYMSTVRRVTVENGVVVVVGKDGKVDRLRLANIVRMSIAP